MKFIIYPIKISSCLSMITDYEMIVNIKNASGSNIFDRSSLIDVVGSWWDDCDEIRFKLSYLILLYTSINYSTFSTILDPWPKDIN